MVTSPGFEIRRATPADAEGIAAAHADSIRSIGPQFYSAETVTAWGSGLASELYVKAMASGEVFWIAVPAVAGGHEVLGFSSHRVDENQHGVSVYVRGECGRRGIGSALLRAAEAGARQAGANRIDIDSSLAAVEFYKKHGFEEVDRGEHQLPTGQPMNCVFMRKVLVHPEAMGRRTSA